MKDLNGRLLKLGASDISDAVLEEITDIKLDLNLEADKEELFWEQRARVNWLQMGDRNTAFFHKNATHRRRKNRIQGLENEVGNLTTDESEITVLDLCIEDTQGAFVPGRQITDNILVAYEVLHSFKKRRGTSKKSFALKLDMSKAYDRVEWSFLEKMMHSMGFCENWTLPVMRCITNVVYTVVVNRKNGEEFRPQRGLRRGDPLSPYLFLTCAEGFSRLIALAKREGSLVGTKVGRGNVSVSHLFFADDSILFGEASAEGANRMKSVIQEYEKVSGQLVNFEKSLIYYSGNVDSLTKDQVGRILGVRNSNNPEKYLRLPTMVGRRKKHAFVELKEKCMKLLGNWKMKFLSARGKEGFTGVNGRSYAVPKQMED
ncbi:uncharacterized protein LOC128034843 [Gossypium raimondii]|uniref:uncharacterized protein LOC128034843 n=1 Tax=Gossypium raimondii TaxID=29730 RepID=UPI00227B7C85|nr:uncharacterized protein LOC128034843 [Gossypium raimondii]